MNTITIEQLQKLGTEQMLFAQLLGKIAERLEMPKGEMPFYRAKQRLIDAGNALLEFIENGDVIEEKSTVFEEGKYKTISKVRIRGAVGASKDVFHGISTLVPGIVKQKAIRTYRLRSKDKAILSKLSSVQFYRSEFCTNTYISRIHETLLVDAHSRELPIKRKFRYEGYRDAIMSLESFYLSYKYDGRGRMGPDAGVLEGFRPHGKCYESAAFELAPRELTEYGRRLLESLEYEPVELHNAVTKHELLSCLRVPQVTKALDTNSTGMTVEFDVTNSGLLIAGLCFKSPEMLMATNGYGSDQLADSHTVFGDVYGLDRDTAKKVHTPLLHGSSTKTIAGILTEITGKSYSVEDVYAANEKAYGKAVHNINAIALYGRQIMSNHRSEVSWTMPNGFRATHRAYTTSVPLELQLNGRKVKVMSDMPLLLDAKGMPVYDSNAPGAKDSTSTKMMGLYADIIHSIDGYVLSRVIDAGIELLPKHDAFLVHPNDGELLKTTLQDIYSDVYERDLIRGILSQIEAATGVEAPELFIGNAENRVKQSELFLSVE